MQERRPEGSCGQAGRSGNAPQPERWVKERPAAKCETHEPIARESGHDGCPPNFRTLGVGESIDRTGRQALSRCRAWAEGFGFRE